MAKPKDGDITWNGEPYLRPLKESRFAKRRSTQEEIEAAKETVFWFSAQFQKEGAAIDGETRATVVSDAGEKVDFVKDSLEALWETLSEYLLSEETRWLEFTVSFAIRAGSSLEFAQCSYENKKTIKRRVETDGTRVLVTHSIPYDPGEEAGICLPSLRERLDSLKLLFEAIPKRKWRDSYYSEAELQAKGVIDAETWKTHIEETQGEEKWRARVTIRDDETPVEKVVWEVENRDKGELQERLLKEGKRYKGQGARFHFGLIERTFSIDRPPFLLSQLRILSGVLNGLGIIEEKGEDSPEAQAFEMGLDLGEAMREFYSLVKAPKALSDPRLGLKKKGEQKKRKPREDRGNLLKKAREWLKSNDDEALSNIRLLDKFIKFGATEKWLTVPIGDIRHSDDSKGYSRTHFANAIFGKMRPSRTRQGTG